MTDHNNTPWTDLDRTILLRLAAEGQGLLTAARVLGRTAEACRRQLQRELDTPTRCPAGAEAYLSTLERKRKAAQGHAVDQAAAKAAGGADQVTADRYAALMDRIEQIERQQAADHEAVIDAIEAVWAKMDRAIAAISANISSLMAWWRQPHYGQPQWVPPGDGTGRQPWESPVICSTHPPCHTHAGQINPDTLIGAHSQGGGA